MRRPERLPHAQHPLAPAGTGGCRRKTPRCFSNSTKCVASLISTLRFDGALVRGVPDRGRHSCPRRDFPVPVGLSLAFLNVNILATAAAIGVATLTMVTLGVIVGCVLGVIIGQRAEILAGCCS